MKFMTQNYKFNLNCSLVFFHQGLDDGLVNFKITAEQAYFKLKWLFLGLYIKTTMFWRLPPPIESTAPFPSPLMNGQATID
jgi:hypothetical protein